MGLIYGPGIDLLFVSGPCWDLHLVSFFRYNYKSISYLFIKYCSLTELTTPILTDCHQLQGLYIMSNHISNISKEAFTAFKDTLLWLDLSTNNLGSVGADEFSELTSLTVLYMNYNSLNGGVSQFAFCNSQMHTLKLQGCSLTQFPQLHCLNATLVELYLDWNNLAELHDEDVKELVNLQLLYLNDNSFINVEASMFTTLVNILWHTHIYSHKHFCYCKFCIISLTSHI